MIISESQIMQLMDLVRQFQNILLCTGEETSDIYNSIEIILNAISNQQSEELKEIV